MNQQSIEETLSVNVVEGDDHTEENSEFYCYAQRVKTVADVNKGFQKMKMKFADATHISCAYRLKNPVLNKDQGYEDDGEIGQGRAILNAIKEKAMIEMCVFVIRFYGGKHLGSRRFEIAKNLTFSAIRAYKIARQSKMQRLKSMQRSDSQTSLLSEALYTSWGYNRRAADGSSKIERRRSWHTREKRRPWSNRRKMTIM